MHDWYLDQTLREAAAAARGGAARAGAGREGPNRGPWQGAESHRPMFRRVAGRRTGAARGAASSSARRSVPDRLRPAGQVREEGSITGQRKEGQEGARCSLLCRETWDATVECPLIAVSTIKREAEVNKGGESREREVDGKRRKFRCSSMMI